MMENKKQIPAYTKEVIDSYSMQIEISREEEKLLVEQLKRVRANIKTYKLIIDTYEKVQPYQVRTDQHNAPLSRDMIRDILRDNPNPISTAELIDLIYSGKTDEKRNQLISVASVMLNQLVRTGELEKYRPKGKQGNLYRWIQK